MTFEQWKTGTERNIFTPRSTALKAIDTAFEKWEKSKSTPNLLDFSTKVKTRITLKGDKWRTSTRNSNGTVEKLVADLAKNPVVGKDFAPLLQIKPKDTKPGIGKIINQKDPYLVIDPWYGIQQVPVNGKRIGLYKPVNAQGQVQATATWDGWVCKVV